VCGLHPGNRLSDKHWNTVYFLNTEIPEALPPLAFLGIRYCHLFLFIENKSLMCGCTVLISIQFGIFGNHY